MKLLNYTLGYLSIALLAIISVWAVVFYLNLIDEVRDSLDDGLENNKMVIIQKVQKDSTTLARAGFSAHSYAIRQIPERLGLQVKDRYTDTLMYTPSEEDLEPFRMLTTAFIHQGNYYELKVVASTIEEDDLLEGLLYSMIWLYVFILISVVVINNLLLRRIWTPFYRLLDKLKTFRLDRDQSIETTTTRVKEFKELNETVDRLVTQTVNTYHSQKQFIENAAHELQTPLAISLNKLELLAENEDLSDKHLEAIGQVIETLHRLSRLNKSLLLISKIENNQYGEMTKVSINEIVKTLISEYEDFAGIRKVHIHVQENAGLDAFMNKDLAAILLSNLLKNAIIHNIRGGDVQLTLNANSLVISNTGIDVPLKQQKMFRRFQKESNKKSSIGLGLAIAKAIADLYDMDLSYSYYQERHEMKINFKKSR